MGSGGLADGKSPVSIYFCNDVISQWAVGRADWSRQKGSGGVWVDGVVGLLSKSPLEESIGYSSLALASVLTAPEAADLRGLNCVTWHGESEKV